ncbi:hypothetical protein MMC28_000020 [Mycoblastus sanguinarius]|nr:hypothetical protein [Mycoblastus sanguinarius]
MEQHSSHAHPLPDGQKHSSHQLSASSHAFLARTPPTLASQQQIEGLSQQTRRLQLRNAGFRGSFFPARRVSPIFGTSQSAIEQFVRPITKEKSTSSTETASVYSEDLSPSPVNILQEIQKSTKKKRNKPRPGFGTIFQDNTAQEGVNEDASETSWYNEGSNNCSPAAMGASPVNTMKLREGSLNQKTPPPLSSPLAKQVKGRHLSHLNLRSASFEASKYIEHLESQLASVNAKLDSLVSPTTNKLRSAKLRALTAESRNLRLEVSEWEKKFAERVEEERYQRAEIEMELKIRLQTIEDEVEMKDAKIGELEWELESMRVKVREFEDLEAINRTLEKRVDVLTNLLAHSPSKLDVSSATNSPNKADPTKRLSRPRSMLSKLPSSTGFVPGCVRLSQVTAPEAAFWRSSSYKSSTSIAESPEDPMSPGEEDQLASPTHDEGTMSPDFMQQSRPSEVFEHRSRSSTSFRSAPSSSSRRTSIRSSVSFGSTSWGLPMPAESEPKSAQKHRRMRKFPSGSNTLKPLILPATTGGPSLPASAPTYPSIEAIAKRDILETSLDPTTSFLSKPADSSPISTPIQPSPCHSTTWAQEQTLKALEGKFRNSDYLDEYPSPQWLTPGPEDSSTRPDETSPGMRKRRSRPRSLKKELEEAAATQAEEIQAKAGSYDPFEDGLIPIDEESLPESGQIPIGMDSTPLQASLSNVYSMQRCLAIESDITPKPDRYSVPLVLPSHLSAKALSTTAVATQNAYGIFSRLTSLVSQRNEDPWFLARRLLSNAWLLCSKRLGGMGWWLLGLIYHQNKWRKQKRTADNGVAEENPREEFDWHHFSAEASRSRAAEHYFRDYGGTRQDQSLRTSSSTPPPKPRKYPHLFPCEDCVEPPSRRTFRLWFQFSLAIVLAVGVAIKNGPGILLVPAPPLHECEPLLQGRRPRQDSEDQALDCRHLNGMDSGYGSITFAETLGPADFEEPG